MALYWSRPPFAPRRRLWKLPITPNTAWQRRSGRKTSILRSRSRPSSSPVWSGSMQQTYLTLRPVLAARAKVALAGKAAGKVYKPIASQPIPWPNQPTSQRSPGKAPLQRISTEPRNFLSAANKPDQMGAIAKRFLVPKGNCSAMRPSRIARTSATRCKHNWHAAGAKQPVTCGHRFSITSLKILPPKPIGLRSAWMP